MAEQTDVEKFYDYIDHVAMDLYRRYKMSYLVGIDEALNYLLDDAFKAPEIVADEPCYKTVKEKVTVVEFNPETIRKAIQLALLKGFKHARITNAQMTPDTIGIFMSYLVRKLYPKVLPKKVLDPLIGTGNLVVTLRNHLNDDFLVHGIDDDPLMCKLARNMCDSLEVENQVFLQNTLTYKAGLYDMIVTDFPPAKIGDKLEYLPYLTIMHHLDHLQEGHYFLAVIENDFFDQKQQALFKQMLADKAHLFGLIKLDESLFQTHPKSILILKKKGHKSEMIDDFLLVDLPRFTDLEAFEKAIQKMNQWFEKKEVDGQ